MHPSVSAATVAVAVAVEVEVDVTEFLTPHALSSALGYVRKGSLGPLKETPNPSLGDFAGAVRETSFAR